MTTSYDRDTASTGSNQPSVDAEGHLAWNPSVGLYHKPAANKRESYGGVIGALQDKIVASNGTPRGYPENFAGIIAAIQDLKGAEYQPGSDVGPKPPGDSIDNSDPDNPVYYPGAHVTGQLWFDTRQGRLFIWTEDNEWVQTNGADGLPIIQDFAPEGAALVPGQFWWNGSEQILYIFDGTFIDTDARANVPVWTPAGGGQVELQTTATLPLIATLEDTDHAYSIVTDPDLDQMHNQEDFNKWLYGALQAVSYTHLTLPTICSV